MRALRSAAALVILLGIVAAAIVPALLSRHWASVASEVLGTDDAFATSGLHLRENQIGGSSLRWTKRKSSFEFADVGPGPVDVDLVARGHRSDVTLIANGAIVGILAVGQTHFATRVPLRGEILVFETVTDGFLDHGRTLGTQLASLGVEPVQPEAARARTVSKRFWMVFVALLLTSVLVQAAAGLSFVVAVLPPALWVGMVLPAGLWRSGWLVEASMLMGFGILASALVSRLACGSASARSCLQVSVLVGLTVHGVLAPSPLVVQGDVQMHGHKLGQVARGDLFPTSRTDHKPPFEIPYGFSFYGLLAPFASSDVTNVTVMREGAAAFSMLSVLALAFFLGRASAGFAAAALLVWTLAPVNIRTMGFGNLSNVFAQSIFVLFLVAAGSLPNGRFRGSVLTFLVALSATAHLSSFIVLLTLALVTFFLSIDRHSAAFKPLLAGVLLASGYFATFLPLIFAQVPRLLGERGGSAGVFDPWRLPNQVILGAGWPLLALVALSVVSGRARTVLPLAPSLALTALTLALAALVSPVEVRYMLAVLPLLAIVGASVFDDGSPGGFPRQSLTSIVDLPWLRTLASEAVMLPLTWLLLLAAVVNGVSVLLEFLPLAGV